ncbi:MAG: hypothetical protein M1833_005151 [Piccolia ochrophora]|nr:MAG: hypothetical protein M1833_005151 [Piccolia ochrophora]
MSLVGGSKDEQYQLEHADESKAGMVTAFEITFIVLGTAVVALRIMARKLSNTRLWWDDFLCVVALIFLYGACISHLLCVKYGVGTHTALHSKADLISYGKATFTSGVGGYWLGQLFVKVSIILFYRRIFQTRRFRLVSLCVAILVAMFYTAALIVRIFACTPISKLWNSSLEGRCVNLYYQLLIIGILNIFFDVLILALPVPMVLRLRLSTARKVGLIGVFMLGGLVCGVSIARVVQLKLINNTSDPLYSNVTNFILTNGEICVSIICACLPPMWPFLTRSSKWLGEAGTSIRSYGSNRSKGSQNSSVTQNWTPNTTLQESRTEKRSFDDARGDLVIKGEFTNNIESDPSRAQRDAEAGLSSESIRVQHDFDYSEQAAAVR